MLDLTLEEWSSIAQVTIALFTVVAVLASIYLSVKALREVQYDRRQRQRPHLCFEGGGMRFPVEFVKAGKAIPGINPAAVAAAFPNLPDDVESVRLAHRRNDDGSIAILSYGKLCNHGLGPAIEVHVTWVPNDVWIGSEKFHIGEAKRSEAVYSRSFNTLPLSPSHLAPGGVGDMSRLPTFMEKDFEKKITRVEGIFDICCSDVFGEAHVFKQQFSLFTLYHNEKQPMVHVTFGEPVT